MGAESVYRVIANRWLDELIPMVMAEAEAALTLMHQTGERSLLESQRHTLAWAAIHALIHDLRDASTRRAHGQAETLMTTGADQPMAADTYLTQVSNERYGVHPLINACFAAALVRQYEPEALGTSHPERRQKRPPAGEAGKAPRQISPITHGQHAAQEKGTEQETEKGTEAAFPGWKVVA